MFYTFVFTLERIVQRLCAAATRFISIKSIASGEIRTRIFPAFRTGCWPFTRTALFDCMQHPNILENCRQNIAARMSWMLRAIKQRWWCNGLAFYSEGGGCGFESHLAQEFSSKQTILQHSVTPGYSVFRLANLPLLLGAPHIYLSDLCLLQCLRVLRQH